MITTPCLCVSTHTPSMYTPNHHHIVPQSWGGETVNSNLVWLCPNSHTATHQLLNLYIHAQGEPEWDVIRHYNELVRALAHLAWAQRPSDKPPYTVAHP